MDNKNLFKNNYILTEEDKDKIDKYISDVKVTNKDFQEMCMLSVSFDNFKKELDKYKKNIKEYQEHNTALFIRNNMLAKKAKEQEEKIVDLEEDNYNLKIMINTLKKKFIKLKNFLHEKLFGWGKKDSTYNKVVDDLYNKDILDDKDIKDIEKDNYEL